MTDAFRFTSNPAYELGEVVNHHDARGGVLRVALGGHDSEDIVGMSAGWQRDFTLDQDSDVTVTFDYSLSQNANYESDEWGQVLASLDGRLVGTFGRDYVDEIAGDGNGSSSQSTGWRSVQLDLGRLSAGDHLLTLGGYNQKKTFHDETTEVLLDEVRLSAERTVSTVPAPAVAAAANSPNSPTLITPSVPPVSSSPTTSTGPALLYQSLDDFFAQLGYRIAPTTSAATVMTSATIPVALVPASALGSSTDLWLADQYFRALGGNLPSSVA